jgi:Protein of unknown function (DUF2516)
MALAVIFYDDVTFYLTWLILIGMVIVEVVALVNCLSQRADAFPVVGSLSKNQWSAILLASVIATILCTFTFQLLAFIAITAAAVYMLDVRPALRDATNGSGSW